MKAFRSTPEAEWKAVALRLPMVTVRLSPTARLDRAPFRSPKAPQTWADLAKPEFKGKVVMANPAQSGSAYSQMQQILQLYNWDMMDKIINTATFVTSSRLAYQNIAKGEMPVGLTSEFNIVASQAQDRTDLGDRAVKVDQLRLRRLGGEMIEGHIGPLRNCQHMHRGLRVEVVEDQRVRRLHHRLVRDFPPQDAGEDVGRVIGPAHVTQSTNR